MREIKFRAWSALDNKMYQCDMEDDIQSYFKHDDGITLEQFTGLKDKNGKDIYEGDLIRLFDNENGSLEVVFRNEYVGGWNLLFEGETVSLGARKAFELEIVGNIHLKAI